MKKSFSAQSYWQEFWLLVPMMILVQLVMQKRPMDVHRLI